ncbi:hypothetical protein [uncultured Selenomonas sp.]|uniref:hypothetical protein n=1 Tax=uncultured Selenomonas sp. TaxID=159275 RepID=UPI0025E532A2|nr:hypothetical protein [uncultured Selenomonas sp.]
MNGINGLMDTIRRGVKPKEQKAVRGVIADGRVWVGARSYPFRTAIDCKTDDGCRVWVLISEGGNAVIVGA